MDGFWGSGHPQAWSRKDIQELLAKKREIWNAPEYLTPGLLITFLLDNGLAQRIEIRSKEYGVKSRYIIGDLPFLPLACSFYKRSYVSHATALYVHDLLPEGKIYVNHEQSQRNHFSFKPNPYRPGVQEPTPPLILRISHRESRFIFLNGKNTGDAGVTEIAGPSGQSTRCSLWKGH